LVWTLEKKKNHLIPLGMKPLSLGRTAQSLIAVLIEPSRLRAISDPKRKLKRQGGTQAGTCKTESETLRLNI
jgi:hypothetical protein